jgi:phosphoglycolate phosphatase-like HAD superfamily hydrolase
MRPTVYLFDIDGTLILTGGAGRRAMAAAFTELHGPKGAVAIDFSFAGMTDRAIVRTGLHALGIEETKSDAGVDPVLDAYLLHLEREVDRSDAYRVLPGVSEVLGWLVPMAKTSRVAIGLGTGNVKRGAYTKLARGSLHQSFAFGGFGCDHEDRTALLRVGAQRGAESLGIVVSECRVVVIGDTPKDVSAARGIGAECIGVGTGGFEPRALLDLGAHRAFATLEEPGVREALSASR